MKSKLCSLENCTACYACINVCPKNCISMITDSKKQAVYPKIDYNQCIDCGACSKACPSLNSTKFNRPLKVYAATCKDDEICKNSSSGGVAFFLSKEIIKKNGVVYATSYAENLEVVFRRYNNIEDLKNSQGSKYLHSHIKSTYNQIKVDLEKGTVVLFIGLPCQVAGLYGFLNNKQYDNLLTIDLICHGTPDYEVFKQYSKYTLKEKFKEVKCANFRETALSEVNFAVNFIGENNLSIVNIPHRQNIYITHFLDGIIYRENCYRCIYARPERVSDITLGDFWGLNEGSNIINTSNGVSCVLLNTEKGINLFNNNINGFFTIQKDLSDAVKGNGQLNHPFEKGKYRYRFENLLKKGNIINALKYCNLKKYIFIRIRNYIHNNKLIYKILRKTKLNAKL